MLTGKDAFILDLATPILPDTEPKSAAATSVDTKGATGSDGNVESDSATDSDHHNLIEWGL
jgi:hypothetical protein